MLARTLILALITAVIGGGCKVREYHEPRSEPPVIKGEVATEHEKITRSEIEEDFYQLIFRSDNDSETYRLLKAAATLLQNQSEMIDAMEKAVKQVEKLFEAIQEMDKTLGKTPPEKPNLSDSTERKNTLKKKYSDLAKVYNQKMIEVNFKFTTSGGLPSDETEILPRHFPIR
ncbi:MAG: hypothetical protein AAB415_03195 [Patescibacteria group bacterium]